MASQATGNGPAGITSADFNNDGHLDLAVGNYLEGTTSILLGTGSGTFSTQITLSNTNSSSQPGAIEAADVNNDNNVDLIVVNTGVGIITIFLGDGSGDFSQIATYSTPIFISSSGIVIADLNSDSKPDFAVTNDFTSSIFVYLGNGDGTFTLTYTLSTGSNSQPSGLVTGYFNTDSYLDFAVGNGGTNNVGIFFGDGTGNFGQQTTYSTGLGSYELATADLNRDGVLDIATANYNEGSTTILLGNGDGTFRVQYTFSTGGNSSNPNGIHTADFNRDNKTDLIIVNTGASDVSILLGYGNGKFKTMTTYSTGINSYPLDIVAVDLNSDSRIDFVSTNFNNNTVGVFLSTCS